MSETKEASPETILHFTRLVADIFFRTILHKGLAIRIPGLSQHPQANTDWLIDAQGKVHCTEKWERFFLVTSNPINGEIVSLTWNAFQEDPALCAVHIWSSQCAKPDNLYVLWRDGRISHDLIDGGGEEMSDEQIDEGFVLADALGASLVSDEELREVNALLERISHAIR